MKKLKCITIYPEEFNNKDLSPNEKYFLSIVRFYTNGEYRKCFLKDEQMAEELLTGVQQIKNIKSKLKKLGLIEVGKDEIRYKNHN